MSLLLDLCPKPLSTPAESSEASAEAELFVSEFLETGAGEHDRGGGDRGAAQTRVAILAFYFVLFVTAVRNGGLS